MTTTWLRDPAYDRALDELAALHVAQSVAHAAQARVLARLAARTSRDGWQGEAPFDSLLLDVAGTCHLGQVAAGSRLADAEHLVARLPAVLGALEDGTLRVHQAQVVVAGTRSLEPRLCAEVERRVLPAAGTLCPADLTRLVRRVVLEVDAAAVARKEADAVRERRVWVQAAEDGMSLLCALLPAEQARQVQARLTEQARQARRQGDDRSLDQLRADLLVTGSGACSRGGTIGGAPGAPGGTWPGTTPGQTPARPVGARPVRVVVHVPLAVALGLSDEAADLDGHGPISAAHARRLAVGAELTRACVDEDGVVVAVDPAAAVVVVRTPAGDVTGGTHDGQRCLAPAAADPPAGRRASAPGAAVQARRHLDAALRDLARRPPPSPLPPEPQHDPSAALARLVRTRDSRCDGPGCSVPAARCELDHEVAWPDGPTSASNLVARSQRCHHAKHHGWTAERTPEGTSWTSPGQRRYLVPSRRALRPLGRTGSARTLRAVALHRLGQQLLPLHEVVDLDGASSGGGPAPHEAWQARKERADATAESAPAGADAPTATGEALPCPSEVPPPF